MIYYPLSVLMLAGIREILIISTSRDAAARTTGSTIFGYPVQDATSFGVVEFDKSGKAYPINY